MAGHLRGEGLAGAHFAELVYLVNVDRQPHEIRVPELKHKRFVLHPVHTSPEAADRRPAQGARYDVETGTFAVPPRTVVVFVRLNHPG